MQMSRKFDMLSFDPVVMEIRRKRDYKSLKRICDLCLELKCAIIEFNDSQEYALTPLFRADETVGNIWFVAKIMADRTGETNDSDNKQEKENNE
jgi:hypothetical protein